MEDGEVEGEVEGSLRSCPLDLNFLSTPLVPMAIELITYRLDTVFIALTARFQTTPSHPRNT